MLFRLSFNTVSPEDLMITRLIWIQQIFSEQQLLDINNLIRDYPALDREYVINWIRQLGLNDFKAFLP